MKLLGPLPEDAIAMEFIQMAVAEAPSTDPLEVVRYASSIAILGSRIDANEEKCEPFDTAYIFKRCVNTIGSAVQQTGSLLTSAETVMPESLDGKQVATVLRASENLGMKLAHVSIFPKHEEMNNDDYVLELISNDPSEYLRFDLTHVSFNANGESLLEPTSFIERGGCPAIGKGITRTDLGTNNLFRLFWRGLTEQYILDQRLVPSPTADSVVR